MSGLLVFYSLEEAIKAGYQIYDRTTDGYLVRTRTDVGWALAIVKLKRGPDTTAAPSDP